MKTWEYKLLIESNRKVIESQLNELGAQGWELANAQYNPLSADVFAIVKRMKPD